MRLVIATGAAALALLTILAAVLGTFHDEAFYDYAYGRNGAYDALGEDAVKSLTENFQSFIENEELLTPLFDAKERAHLEDVKGLYLKASVLARLLFVLCIITIGIIILQPDRLRLSKLLLHKTSISLFVLLPLLLILSINWQWSFHAFHNLFFSGNWAFAASSLSILLWGGRFFVLAAAYVWLKALAVACILLLLAKQEPEDDAERRKAATHEKE